MITVPTKLGLTKVAKALASNDAVRSVILRANTNISAPIPCSPFDQQNRQLTDLC